ncbi:ATP-binding cassette domain-containing protein, partial [Georgenia sp. 10Sc9-8]|nr:ATP-binding cassette domain-containing protein [Georgenia halotolerans]
GLRSARARQRRAAERAEHALTRFGDRLWPRREELSYSLSYANRRRLEIARVLASRPRLLLLDEPTAGMNPTETAELTGVLADVHATDPEITVVLVEHKMSVVREISRRVVVLDAGRVIADGTPDHALADPAVVAAYLGAGA